MSLLLYKAGSSFYAYINVNKDIKGGTIVNRTDRFKVGDYH
jgi:hypothetical protein